ncbi:DNA-formamidopyrimidine glycosylase [Roseofilum sp. BLCC_M91]|uniref:Formamidopyrimidine-DNA glycosylase n=1 Tax=Roseofilum halophilum BLCC-M91 TaxID=3022259 RepID=A0ABT7BNN0_9CYAN|nr:DNA-formamidopyrimidine glycosylase [Roseofilum halophilum]MDJ1180776.1 DNA-formamidopyrimidine glycosylase [Roseofilum halophilum BLCC-M91]
MPELPEVETVRRGLNQLTLGQEIEGGEVLCDRRISGLSHSIAHPSSVDEFLQGVRGAKIKQWHRRGKYLLAELTRKGEPGGTLGVHLRMTGQLLWVAPTEPLAKHTRVRLGFKSGKELRFVDQRRFGRVWWVPADVALEKVMTGLGKLGPEPLSEEFSVVYLRGKLENRKRPIKTALLDQSLIAGLGNIYADEAIFLCGIHPETRCCDLSNSQVEGLTRAVVQVLEDSLREGGTTFSHFLNVQGVNGNYAGVAWVYGRRGEPCRRCNTIIERMKLGGRSSHFCPQCQSIKN